MSVGVVVVVDRQGHVGRASAGHGYVEALGPGVLVDDRYGNIDGDALGLVHGHRVRERDLFGGVAGGEDGLAVSGMVGHSRICCSTASVVVVV